MVATHTLSQLEVEKFAILPLISDKGNEHLLDSDERNTIGEFSTSSNFCWFSRY